jgi:Ca-activated chloride channel homolog
MLMNTRNILLIVMILLTLPSAAQQQIAGKVVDEKKEAVMSATVVALQQNMLKGGSVTDFDGHYTLGPLDPGIYDVLVTMPGYDSALMTKIIVSLAGKSIVNFSLVRSSTQLRGMIVKAYKNPLVREGNSGKTILTSEDIKALPTTEISDMVGQAPELYQGHRGKGVQIGGARSSGTLYIIDGVQVQNIGNTANTGIQMAQNTTQFYNPSTEEYKKYTENGFRNVALSPLSTMSVDVDRASYTNIRRIINEGSKPPADAVRIEEMVNYFEYDYPQPTDNDPISINTEVTNCPWRPEHRLLRIGIQAERVASAELPPSNLVFLIDVSGSMESADKLPLLVTGLKLLVQNLRPVDKVAIVTYAGAAGLALPPILGSNKQAILDALEKLQAGGSTAGGAGIQLAYKTALDNFIKGGNNRVILATDGDFNVGISNENELETLITRQRKTGVALTCLGFGTGNYKDAKLELLADKGNGNYHYIDNVKEAQKALVSEFGGTLFTVAKDVKAQIEFNPAIVQGYRLVGYENRLLNAEDFKDDKKDAGDMGAGHTVTIIYEVIPAGAKSKFLHNTRKLKYRESRQQATQYNGELATIRFRYKEPDGRKSKEIAHVIDNQITPWNNASVNTRFATSVAMFGMLLKESEYSGTASYDEILKIAGTCKETDPGNYRAEFMQLVNGMKDYDARMGAK